MDARRVLPANAIVKPFIVMAAKLLGPGRLRLEMVKLAHDLDGRRRMFDEGQTTQPDDQAA